MRRIGRRNGSRSSGHSEVSVAEQREVVYLHVFEGMTFQQIAGTSGESINTIASRYRYALARLRELVK